MSDTLIRVGNIVPKKSSEVKSCFVGLGFEKLDRDAFDPEKAYDKVANLGVKWIRILSGWQKTERIPGVYNFAWLDGVVDNLIKRGLIPWICLSYGNELYDDNAKNVIGGTACPPVHTPEQAEAWGKYVKAVTEHYKDRITHYEIWNEPEWCWTDGGHPKDYGIMALESAKIIRSVYPEAKIIIGALAAQELYFINTVLATPGLPELVDFISFHLYNHNEGIIIPFVQSLRALCKTYNPNIEIINGESGCQSANGAGALAGGAWNEELQAKYVARHVITNIMAGVEFYSYFSALDMREADFVKKEGYDFKDYGYFGLIRADFDENGFATGEYSLKPSYYVVQNYCSIFSDGFTLEELPVWRRPLNNTRIFQWDCEELSIMSQGFRKENGSAALVYWNSKDLMTVQKYESSVSFVTANMPNDIKIIDPISGEIFEVGEDNRDATKEGQIILKNLPLRDYPLILTFGDFI